MKPFRHINATTVADALELLQDCRGRSRLMAGGTDLLGLLKDQVLPGYPELLVNLKSIPELNYIKEDERGLRIGALTGLADIAVSSCVRNGYKVLAEAAGSVATPQIRNMGTIGGNLAQDVRCWYYRFPQEIGGRIMCRRKGGGSCMAVKGDNRYHAIFPDKQCVAVCPSDTAVALAALNAGIKIAGPNGNRMVAAIDFYHPLGNTLSPEEIITEINIPRPETCSRQIFLKHRVRESVDFAIVSVAAVLTSPENICQDAKIVLGAVAAGPYRASEAECLLLGKTLDNELAEAASKAAISKAKPLSMNKYKVEIAKTLVKRALLGQRNFSD